MYVFNGSVYAAKGLQGGSISSVDYPVFGYGNSATVATARFRQDNATGTILDLSGNGGVTRLSFPQEGGILFPGTPINSTNVNNLDDYKEGSWQSYDASGAALGNLGLLFYTKIGRLLHVTGTLQWPVNASPAQAVIGGMPYTTANSAWHGGSVNAFLSAAQDCSWMNPGASTLIYAYDFNGAATRTNAQLSGLVVYAINCTFIV